MTKHGKPITIGKMIDLLKAYPVDTELYFGGLDFYQLRLRGDDVSIEFNQSVSESKGIVTIQNHNEPDPF